MATAEVTLGNDSSLARPRYIDARLSAAFVHSSARFLSAVAETDAGDAARCHLAGVDSEQLRAHFVFDGDAELVDALPGLTRAYLRQPEAEPAAVARALKALRKTAAQLEEGGKTAFVHGVERMPIFAPTKVVVAYASVTTRRAKVLSVGVRGKANSVYATVKPTNGEPTLRVSVDRELFTVMKDAIGELVDLRLRLQRIDHVAVSGEVLSAARVGSSTFDDVRAWYRRSGVRHVGG